MSANHCPISRGVRQGKHRDHAPARPSELPCHVRRQPCLHAQAAQQILQVRKLRFHLYHQQCAARWRRPDQQVDPPALTPLAEAGLRLNGAAVVAEGGGEGIHDRRVLIVQEAR